MTYEQYQQICSNHISELLGLTDILDQKDPYDIFDDMQDSFTNNEDPIDFIEEVFAEDISKQEYEADQEDESLNQMDEDDD